MSDYTLNSVPILDVRLTLHRAGLWTADVLTTALTTPDLAAGSPAALQLGPMQLTGTVARGGAFRGSEYARIVGGQGGLGTITDPQGFLSVSAQFLVNTLLSGAGETLSSTTNPALLSQTFSLWIIREEPVATALTRVADAIGCLWRVLTDGTVWLGTDTFGSATLTTPTLLDAYPERGEFLVGIVAPELLPGQSFSISSYGGNVSAVEYRLHDRKMRMRVWTEDP